MTYVNDPCIERTEVADDASVLITISSSEAEGMIRRWGVISHAIGALSIEALMRGAVDDDVVALLREQRPQQYVGEREITEKVKSILDSGYRVFVRDANDPIDSARAGEIQARTLLAQGSGEYQSGSLFVLHLTVEPFGAAARAAHHDNVGAAHAREALRRDMCCALAAPQLASRATTTPEPEAGQVGTAPTDRQATAADDSNVAADTPPRGDDDDHNSAPEKWSAADEPAADNSALASHYAEPVEVVEAAALADSPESVEPPCPEEQLAEGEVELEEVTVAAAMAVEVEPEHEQITAEAELEPNASVAPQPKKHATKADALTEQFRPKVEPLDFRGLFVGNFGFQRDTVVDVAKLSALSPQTISAYLMKANALRQSSEHEKALSYYRVLLKSDPDNADYRFLYGKTLMEMGRVQSARECFERARELGHENAARELEQLEQRQTKKPALAFLQFWRRAESQH